MHLGKDRNGRLQVKRHAGYERVLGLGEGTMMVAYVASKLMGLLEDGAIVVATLSLTNIVLRALVLCDGHLCCVAGTCVM